VNNLQTFDEEKDWDQIIADAAGVDGVLVYWGNSRLQSSDDTVKTSVIEHYQFNEDVPVQLLSLMQTHYYGYIEFRNYDVAIDFVTDYFPRRDELPDGVENDPFWYNVAIVSNDGVTLYENQRLRRGKNRPDEA